MQFHTPLNERENSGHVVEHYAGGGIVRAAVESVIKADKTISVFVFTFEFGLAFG